MGPGAVPADEQHASVRMCVSVRGSLFASLCCFERGFLLVCAGLLTQKGG